MHELIVENRHVHIVGIKGAGCAALAEVLHYRGAIVSGSDKPQDFYTSDLLKALGVKVYTQFLASHITPKIDVVVYSAAYTFDNPEIKRAKELNIPVLSYPQALGLLSKNAYGIAVAGVHGKTTTTAMLGLIAQSQQWPATVVVGSKVSDFDNRATLTLGEQLFIAESCEYREHFRYFYPKAVLITAIEWDHQDYFKSELDLEQAFIRFILQLPMNGIALYNADCLISKKVIKQVSNHRKDLQIYSFARSDVADIIIKNEKIIESKNTFNLITKDSSIKVQLALPGSHNVANATAALAISKLLAQALMLPWKEELALKALLNFKGLARRLELIGQDEQRNILVLDDYAHHPTAIALTLRGLREFYPNRRLVLSFMSHTYSRTLALFDEFVASIMLADVVVLHKIYASAREQNLSNISGEQLYFAIKKLKNSAVYYEEEPKNAIELVNTILQADDIFVTMGAGDNFELSHQLVAGWQKL